MKESEGYKLISQPANNCTDKITYFVNFANVNEYQLHKTSLSEFVTSLNIANTGERRQTWFDGWKQGQGLPVGNFCLFKPLEISQGSANIDVGTNVVWLHPVDTITTLIN